MNALLWWTGAAFWLWFSVRVLIPIIMEIYWGFVTAADYMRWRVACARANERKLTWRYFPIEFIQAWWDFLGPKDHFVGCCDTKGGKWRGRGKWEVWDARGKIV